MRIGIDARKIDDFGIGTYIEGLTAALLDRGESVVAFGPAGVQARFGARPRLTVVPFGAPLYSIRELAAPRRLIAGQELDLFHAPHYTLPFVPLPSVVTVHDLIHLRLQGLRALHRRAYARWMIGSAVGRASAVICVSRAVADEISAFRPAAAKKIHVVENGVDRRFFQAPTVPLPEGLYPRGYFLYVGNDRPHKNLERLVAAYSVARARGLRESLVLAGATPARFRTSDGVVLAGRVDGPVLRALYGGAVALTLVSLEEGFGLPLAEALACGVPAIVSDIAVMREVGGAATLRVDPHSVDEIAAAMMRIAADQALRSELVERARDTASRFRWERAAEATASIYRDVAGRG